MILLLRRTLSGLQRFTAMEHHNGAGLSLRRNISQQCDDMLPAPSLEEAERSFAPKGR